MGLIYDVTDDNFEEIVVEKSYERPVVIDFWAPWCGPCRVLKPLLEKLSGEYGFVLAKINTDENPHIAQEFGVSGIPDVRIFINGKEVDRFVGALPEPKLREILSKYIKSEADKLLDEAKMEFMAGNLSKAEEIYEKLLQEYPENKKIALEAAQFFIKEGRLDKAVELLDSIKEYHKEYFSKAQALKELITFKKWCEELEPENELDKLLKEGACLALQENYKDALEKFLKVVQLNKKYKDEAGRKSMVAIFNLLGESNPLTKEYRKKLAMWLY
ncbi:thioredoxin [Persephonella hydrogeniphila]|uniref:Thioredoxin n=1 Tax=Persephonella hydrogeniphila TaxID=198703 RepID=A0A285NGN9_9AQUI|nr:thioredoxin [Persephonella hydrogeniphila]SNZ08609.1 thioredoxin [Persephonella hydrogeniphila]